MTEMSPLRRRMIEDMAFSYVAATLCASHWGRRLASSRGGTPVMSRAPLP
jgi:hypothetical protein